MPLIQVTAQPGARPKHKQDALMSRISNAVLKAEGASPADPAAQALVWGHYSGRFAGRRRTDSASH